MCLFHCKAIDTVGLFVNAEYNGNALILIYMHKFRIIKYNQYNVNEISFHR